MDLGQHFGGGLPQITVASFLLGWFLFHLVLLHLWNHHKAIALFTELNQARLTFWGRGLNWGDSFIQVIFTLFPYEDIGFSLNCSYHSGKNSLFCYCHLKKQKECIHQKEKPFWKGERVFFPNVWKSAPCIWNIARRSLIRNHPLCIALYISLYGIEHWRIQESQLQLALIPCHIIQPINFSFDLRGIFLIVYIYCFLMKFENEPSSGSPPPASVPE